MMFRYIDTETFLKHLQMEGFHVRDVGLLDAALNRPRASVFGEDAYPTLAMKAAAQTQSIIKNHPMVDGNKRTSWFALNALLALNFFVLECSQDEAFEFLLGVATDKLNLDQVAEWIQLKAIEI